MSWILPFRSWRLYQALLSWPTFARSWGHLRKCQFCFLMLQSWPGRERKGVNRVQPTIQMCIPPHRDPQHICLQQTVLPPWGVTTHADTCQRALCCLRELNPSLLQSCLTHWKESLGCATLQRRRERWPLVPPADTSHEHGTELAPQALSRGYVRAPWRTASHGTAAPSQQPVPTTTPGLSLQSQVP